MHDFPNDFVRFTEFGVDQLLRKNSLCFSQIQRRGDIFAVLHTIVGQLFAGGIEWLSRLPCLRRLVLPISRFLNVCIILSYKAHFFLLRKAKRLHPAHVGEGLKGPFGTLALWSLGYFALARKTGYKK